MNKEKQFDCGYEECEYLGYCPSEDFSMMISDLFGAIKNMENITESEEVKLQMKVASEIAQDISKRFIDGVTKGS